jgi:hypothetical protein
METIPYRLSCLLTALYLLLGQVYVPGGVKSGGQISMDPSLYPIEQFAMIHKNVAKHISEQLDDESYEPDSWIPVSWPKGEEAEGYDYVGTCESVPEVREGTVFPEKREVGRELKISIYRR